ncbi:RNA polymerase sigma-70 factor, sigma-E family [Klenkia soli]|uniref:RNA polymerase sigma-70 factor, sigma-E family n=1 Tax=Klenkia soli TaxID=1052260 RepID=A0A1H0C8U6_9ACTN|nr:SigE family RNA polymerase sigma factor [Klenkia soli]SDN54236.1 RNA polymerase sigma-70 factor, sigma-E family [Klenkia soli]
MTATDDEFAAFVSDRSTALLRTAYLLTGDRGHAEDLLQTALVKTYRHWGRLTNREDPSAFVRRVLVTTHAGWRRRVRIAEFLSTTPLLQTAADEAPDLGERDRLVTALAALPPRMRAVLVLRYWEDLSEAGTAEVLGCSVNTVKTHTTRGLGRLRAQLAEPAETAGER